MRTFSFVFAAILILFCCSFSACAETADSTLYVRKVENLPDDFIFGMDVSSVLAEEASGVVYRDEKGESRDLFAILKENGYAVVTADMRGHGKNAPKLSHIADRNGAGLLIEDEKALLGMIWERFPRTQVYLHGRSMGSIIARKLMQTHSGAFE